VGLSNQDYFIKIPLLLCWSFLLSLGQLEKLIPFSKELSIEKNNPDVYYYLAIITQKAGQLDEARNFCNFLYAFTKRMTTGFLMRESQSGVSLRVLQILCMEVLQKNNAAFRNKA